MALAKQCDRCKKYYTENGTTMADFFREKGLRFSEIALVDYTRKVNIEFDNGELNFDLCDDCVMELFKWIAKRGAEQ